MIAASSSDAPLKIKNKIKFMGLDSHWGRTFYSLKFHLLAVRPQLSDEPVVLYAVKHLLVARME